jgi:hypothetical protein
LVTESAAGSLFASIPLLTKNSGCNDVLKLSNFLLSAKLGLGWDISSFYSYKQLTFKQKENAVYQMLGKAPMDGHPLPPSPSFILVTRLLLLSFSPAFSILFYAFLVRSKDTFPSFYRK